MELKVNMQSDVLRTVATVLVVQLLLATTARAISDTWALGDTMGQLDSSGTLAFWRDFSTSAEIPDPSDDFDRIIVVIEEFYLSQPGQSQINLLELKHGTSSSPGGDLFQPDTWERNLDGMSGTGHALRTQPEALGSSLSVFLFIFNSQGKIFKDSPLEADIRRKDACIGVEFPRLVNNSRSRDLCMTGRCRLHLSLPRGNDK